MSGDDVPVPLTQAELELLDSAGVQVTSHGMITDWQYHPPWTARPLEELDPAATATRKDFTPAESQALLRWIAAAQAEGVSGNRVFELMEGVYPQHSATSWQSKWTRTDNDDLVLPQLRFDDPFPGLEDQERDTIDLTQGDEDTPSCQNRIPSISAESSSNHLEQVGAQSTCEMTTVHHPLDSDPTPVSRQQASYAALRLDDYANVVAYLGFSCAEEFESWVSSDWVMEAYDELASCCLDDPPEGSSEANQSRLQLTDRKGRSNYSHIHQQAVRALEAESPRYLSDTYSKSSWTADDHAIRFVARLSRAERQPGRLWEPRADADADAAALASICDRVIFFLRWVLWVHRPITGTSKTQNSKKREQDDRLSFLHGCRINYREDHNEITWNEDSDSHQDQALAAHFDNIDTISVEPSRCNDNAQVSDRADSDASPPASIQSSTVTKVAGLSSNPGPVRGSKWLSASARTQWQQNSKALKLAWGLKNEHQNTCILLPYEWRHITPMELLRDFDTEQLARKENLDELRRHVYSYDNVTIAWARAAVWFQDWRTGADLARFFGVSEGEEKLEALQGSHLCHQRLCIVEEHMTCDSFATNISRNSCKNFAQRLRNYNITIPAECTEPSHQPPCKLQHAALTVDEALHIQFSILRQASGRSPAPQPVPPSTHDPRRHAYEYQLPILFATEGDPMVNVDPSHLTQPRTTMPGLGLRMACPLCCRGNLPTAFSMIEGFWSHVKFEHLEEPEEDRVQVIVQQTAEYLDWLKQRNYHHNHNANPRKWLYMQQTREPSFSWDDFMTWNLHADRKREKRPRDQE